MKRITIREARQGLSHPEKMFAEIEEVGGVHRGAPVARLLPVGRACRSIRSLADLRAPQRPLEPPLSRTVFEAGRDRCG